MIALMEKPEKAPKPPTEVVRIPSDMLKTLQRIARFEDSSVLEVLVSLLREPLRERLANAIEQQKKELRDLEKKVEKK